LENFLSVQNFTKTANLGIGLGCGVKPQTGFELPDPKLAYNNLKIKIYKIRKKLEKFRDCGGEGGGVKCESGFEL